MTDRALLELAAKAAGMNVSWDTHDPDYCAGVEWMFLNGERSPDNSKYWTPLTDDGDALRLALKLGLCIEPYPFYSLARHSVIVKQRTRGDQMREANPTEVVEVYGTDAAAATRRAIVRSAAAVGMTPNVAIEPRR